MKFIKIGSCKLYNADKIKQVHALVGLDNHGKEVYEIYFDGCPVTAFDTRYETEKYIDELKDFLNDNGTDDV